MIIIMKVFKRVYTHSVRPRSIQYLSHLIRERHRKIEIVDVWRQCETLLLLYPLHLSLLILTVRTVHSYIEKSRS